MRAYIAGPMTGLHGYNAVAFRAAAADWEDQGWQVTTPLDTTSLIWRRHFGRDFDPFTDKCDYGDRLLAETWVENVRAITEADIVAFLPGWEKSKGCLIEHAIAAALGKHRQGATTYAALGSPPETICQEADRLVSSDRQSVYGHPFNDFTKTGRLWAVVLGLPEVTPEQVALCLAMVKVSRLLNSPDHRDSLVDLCGYAKTYHLVRERRAGS